ncbi:MAG: SulP family inorganic anion transporter, partial [Pseudomonadota bacterium]
FVSVGPVALASLLVADAVNAGDIAPAEAGAIMAIEVGVILTVVGLVRMGRLVNFVSEPALLGFTAAVAVLICASQISSFLGVDLERSGNLVDLAGTLGGIEGVHVPTLMLGAAVLAVLLLGNRYAQPALERLGLSAPVALSAAKAVPLLAIAAAAVVAPILAPETALVQEPEGGLPMPALPPFAVESWLALLVPSAVVALVVFVTGAAVIKSLPGPGRKAPKTNREAVAVGAANIAAAATGGYVTGVSLSRSALVHDCGARSPLASAVAALAVVPVILFGGPLLARLPEAALAALVIGAVFGLVKVNEIWSVWCHSRAESVVIALTFLGTVLLGVQAGLLTGAVAGIACFLWISSLPRIAREGHAREDGIYRTVRRDEVEVDTLPVLVVRIDRSIYFANVGYCEERIGQLVSEHDEANALLLDMRAVNDVDATGVRMLDRLLKTLADRGVTVGFAALHAPVAEQLESCAAAGPVQKFLTVEEGVEALTAEVEEARETA